MLPFGIGLMAMLSAALVLYLIKQNQLAAPGFIQGATSGLFFTVTYHAMIFIALAIGHWIQWIQIPDIVWTTSLWHIIVQIIVQTLLCGLCVSVLARWKPTNINPLAW